MGPDKLECLLDSFIASRREIDTIDAIPQGGFSGWEPQGKLADDSGDLFNTFDLNKDQFHFPGLLGRTGSVAANSDALAQAVQATQVSALGRQLADMADQFSINKPNSNCVIRFEKSCVIVAPEEQTISLTIVRSDASKDTIIKVTWKTRDKTALSGTHYIGSSGEIVFDRGVVEKTIPIKILKTSDDAMDLRFNVELSVENDAFDPKPMTVTLKKLDNFYADERQVVESLPSSLPFTAEDIRSVLEIALNSRTFHMALTHLCSAADSVHLEFALALDLSRLCLPNLRRESVLKVLKDFFRMEDIDY